MSDKSNIFAMALAAVAKKRECARNHGGFHPH